MKKFFSAAAVLVFVLSAVNAYNPPVYGDNLYELSSPRQLANGSSVVGGGLFYASPESIAVNPALTAKEQRIDLNLANTSLFSSNETNDSRYGNAFQAGLLIPFKRFVFSGYGNLTTVTFNEMNLGNSFNMKFGLAKEITDRLTVGANLNSGIFWWKSATDWDLSANLGFVYTYGNLGFLKDFRYGVSILNLGKNFGNTTLPGIDGGEASSLPSIATLKLGTAGTLVQNDIIKLGFSFDFTVPAFQNLITDMNAQFEFKDAFIISVGETFNLAELINKNYSLIPSVAFLFKFSFDVKNNQYLESHSWSQSEMTVSAGYRNLYKTVHAISAGVDIDLGMSDNEAPKITVWDIE